MCWVPVLVQWVGPLCCHSVWYVFFISATPFLCLWYMPCRCLSYESFSLLLAFFCLRYSLSRSSLGLSSLCTLLFHQTYMPWCSQSWFFLLALTVKSNGAGLGGHCEQLSCLFVEVGMYLTLQRNPWIDKTQKYKNIDAIIWTRSSRCSIHWHWYVDFLKVNPDRSFHALQSLATALSTSN